MTETEWKDRFIKRLVELGLDEITAQTCYVAGIYSYNNNPEQAAEDEASYWQADTPH